jgi:proteasome accessory factor C
VKTKKQPGATDASAQLKRLLAIVPRIADGEEHSIASIAAMLGVTPATVANDLVSVGERYDTPGGFVEGLQVFIQAQKVSLRTSHFLRPMRLTVAELHALDLGLAMIRAERPAEEWAAIEKVRERIRAVAAKLPGDAPPEGPYAVAGGAPPNAQLAAVRDALAKRRKLRIAYRRGDATAATTRVVCPYRLILAGPGWYLVAYCEHSKSVRVFRVDRIDDSKVLSEKYVAPAPAELAVQLGNGPVFASADAPVTLRVRYSPRVARWIEEREQGSVEADGSYVVDYPLADVDWALRHVLQYGAEAEIVEPAETRRAIRERLESMLEMLQ